MGNKRVFKEDRAREAGDRAVLNFVDATV